MNKYLVLKFENATLFKNKRTKDKIFDLLNGNRDRKDEQFFKEPITVYQISNMIHVLFGERPVPSLRKVLYSKNDYLFEKAKKSYLKIDNYMRFNDNKKEFEYTKEIIQTKKAVYNAWNPQSFLNWNRVFKLLEKDLYDEFLVILKEEFNISPKKDIFIDVVKIIKNSKNKRLNDFYNKINKMGKTSLTNDINNDTVQINMNPRTTLTVNNGIEYITKFNGEILVPIDDNDIEKIKNNKGCATLLDGGLVYIKKIEDAKKLSIDGFKLVEEISTEKY